MKEKILEQLQEIAVNNPGIRNRYKLAAAVVYKNRIVSIGVNSYKTHPIMMKFGKNDEALHLHAEVDALTRASRVLTSKQLSKSDLYVVRVKRPDKSSKKWITGLAKPCPGCVRAIEHYGIKNVFWTADCVCS
jgi:deoxycytidylate deaminase